MTVRAGNCSPKTSLASSSTCYRRTSVAFPAGSRSDRADRRKNLRDPLRRGVRARAYPYAFHCCGVQAQRGESPRRRSIIPFAQGEQGKIALMLAIHPPRLLLSSSLTTLTTNFREG